MQFWVSALSRCTLKYICPIPEIVDLMEPVGGIVGDITILAKSLFQRILSVNQNQEVVISPISKEKKI